jgi:class 3 adenylate cyclase/CBS domain-containing protein
MDTKARILMVDDAPANLRVLSHLLGDEYDITVASNGTDALASCGTEQPPDCVLLDVQMSGLDGYEVCRRLKADPRTQDIPVIFVTGLSEVDDETRGFELGAMDYVTKPVQAPVLKSRVRSAVGLRRKTAELEAISAKLGRYLAPEVSQAIHEGRTKAEIASERRLLTVFFSDIVDFTAATERLEPEALSTLLNSYLEAMAGIVFRHGGTLDKFMGDAVMVFFGDPASRGPQEDAVACVAMAMEMRDWLGRAGRSGAGAFPFQVRFGINTGHCTVGSFGSSQRLEYTIIGGQVNIAKRLEAAAEPGEILISQETWALVRDRIECVRKRPLQLKGIPYPVEAYQAVGWARQQPDGRREPTLGSLMEAVQTFAPELPLGQASRALALPNRPVAVVAENGRPVGLIAGRHLLGSPGAQPGSDDSPVQRVMDPAPLVLDAGVAIPEAIRRAADREPGQECDPVVVTRDGTVAGIVSLQALLAWLLEARRRPADATG